MYKHSKTLSILFRLLLGFAALVALAPHGHSPASANADLGTIAYVRPSTHDIHLFSPDGAYVVSEYQATGNWLDQYLDLDLWMMYRYGNGQTLLVQDVRAPTWSLQMLQPPVIME